jgi:hypothetical protein
MHETGFGNSPFGPSTALKRKFPLVVVQDKGPGSGTGTAPGGMVDPPSECVLTSLAANKAPLATIAATKSKDFLAPMIYLLLNRFVILIL